MSWLMPGRWTQEKATSNMMGMPVESFSITGYDNHKKKYVTCSVSTLETTLNVFSGSIDRGGRIIDQYGQIDEPTTGEIGKNVRSVTRIIDDNKYIREIYDLAIAGTNNLVVEITYTRKK